VSLSDTRPVRRVQHDAKAPYDPTRWPFTLAPVQALLEDGLDLPAGVTLLVGENGSGKSTIVEALAAAYGLNPEGGSAWARHSTRVTESPLGEVLQLVRSPGQRGWSYFLRAETMHGLYTYLEENPGKNNPAFHEMSHGESFLEVFRNNFDARGFFLMDEPESALSFQSCLALLVVLDDLRREGSQVVVATHSPLIAALPGAQILELGEHGIRETTWDQLDLLDNWRSYLADPKRWLRHLFD